jgi:hypothetical protein
MSGFQGDKDVQVKAQADAARELEKLTPRVPSLVITITGAGAGGATPQVTLDGKSVPPALLGEEQPLNPGTHQLVVSSGAARVAREMQLKESEHHGEKVDLSELGPVSGPARVAPAADAAVPPATATHAGGGTQRTLAYVALATGGAGLVLGGVTGAMALGKHSSLESSSNCAKDVCVEAERSNVQSLDTLRTLSTVGFVAGGVLAATGVVLLLTDKRHSESAAAASNLALHVGPAGVTLKGAFQ